MKAKKSLGQNFLINDTIINQIVSLFSSGDNDLIIEIGPGRGALTNKLVKKKGYLKCIELDTDLRRYLDKYKSNKCEIIYDDILTIDFNKLIDKKYNNIYVIGNLPYYITSPIIEHLIKSKIVFNEMYFMVQKEVADRYSAIPGSKEYGYMTVFIKHYYDVTTEIIVGKENFKPVPKVTSAVIKLLKNDNVYEEKDEEYFDFIKECFKLKRKTLKNNLREYDLNKINTVLKKYSFEDNVRSEYLPEEVFRELYNNLK